MRIDSNKAVLIRVDASPQIGAGHLIRMLALGQLLAEAGHEVHFATIPYNISAIDFFLKDSKFKLHYMNKETSWNSVTDADGLLEIALHVHPLWVVIDGYHFGADYESKIKMSGYRLLRIDDIPEGRKYFVDAILNQNFGADSSAYSVGPGTRILAGLQYVLLRREFREMHSQRKISKGVEPYHILVSLGGGTEIADTLIARIAEGLSTLSDRQSIETTLLVGKMSKNIRNLEEEVKVRRWPVLLKEHSSNMAAEMLKADLAIVSGGSTMWELIYMNVPFLAVALTEPQREYLRMLSQNNLCVDLGWHENLTADLIGRMTQDLIQDQKRREQLLDTYECTMDRGNIGKELLEIFR